MLHVSLSTSTELIQSIMIGLFCITGCGHCTKMKPQFSEAAKKLAADKTGLLGAVDATVNEALSQKYNIKGFPTLKLFVKGAYTADYDGKRTVKDIYEFVKNSGASKKDEL